MPEDVAAFPGHITVEACPKVCSDKSSKDRDKVGIIWILQKIHAFSASCSWVCGTSPNFAVSFPKATGVNHLLAGHCWLLHDPKIRDDFDVMKQWTFHPSLGSQ